MPSSQLRRRFATLALATCALVLAAGASAQARGFQTGLLDISSFVQNPSSSDDGSALAFQRTKAAGATYVKTNLYWNAIAPDQPSAGFTARNPDDPGYTNWGPIDEFVRQAAQHGLEPILDIVDTPAFARSACTNDPACSPVPADYGDFAAAVAKRYSGSFTPAGASDALPRVTYFQAWVEPNLSFFYKPIFKGKKEVAPTNYRGILNAFYDAVKSVNSSDQVISAGLAPLARPGATIGPLDFMRRLLCLQGRANPKPGGCSVKTKLDIWATHPYTTGGPTHSAPGPDDVSLGDLPQMSTTLKAADRFGRISNSSATTPFWVTEFSWDSNPPDKGGLPWSIHARWTAEAMYRMYKAGVDTMLWFNLRDEAKAGRPDAEVYQSGLYLRGATMAKDKPKRVLYAFRYPFVALLNPKGFHFWGRTATSTKAQIKIQVDNGPGGYTTVGHATANRDGIFEGNVVNSKISKTGLVRAVASGGGIYNSIGNQNSLPFSLKYVKDFYQPPFGGNPNSSGPTQRALLAPRYMTPRF